MKTVLTGIVGVVVGGMILFLLQSAYSSWSKSGQYALSFDDHDSGVLLTGNDLTSLQAMIKETRPGLAEIRKFEVRNTGSADISDKSFSVPFENAVIWKNTDEPNGNEKNVGLSTDGKVFTVQYRYLPAGARHTFWVARINDGFVTPSQWAPNAPGVTVTNGTHDNDADDFLGWLIWIALVVVGFFVGIVLVLTSVTSELKKRGLDYAEIMKRPIAGPASSTDISGPTQP